MECDGRNYETGSGVHETGNENHQTGAGLVNHRFGSEVLAGGTVTPQDANHDAIREGDPPNRSGPVFEATSTDNLGPPAAFRLVMVIVVWSLRMVAVLIATCAGLGAFFAMMFRFDSSDEFEWVKQVDVELGGAFALAVVLFFVPNRITKPVQCILIVGAALLVWLFVSWNLIAHHEWVDRVRSGL
jgi:hypothetical protein